MKVGMPRTDERDIHFPRKVSAEDAHIVEARDVKHVRTKSLKLTANVRSMTLKKRIVVQALVHLERRPRSFQGDRSIVSLGRGLSSVTGVNICEGKATLFYERDQPIACHRHTVNFQKGIGKVSDA